MKYRLHYFPESGNSYKLGLMLTLCGQAFEPVWTDFGSGVTRTAAWRESVNPMGEIPVLEEDGVALTQTAPILLQLAARYGRFGAANDRDAFEVLRWLFWDNQKLSGTMAAYRFRRAFQPPSDPAVLKYMKGRVDDYLGILEARVRNHAFVIGDSATIVDISMCGYLLPGGGERVRPGGQPSRHPRLARPHRGAAGLAGALRPASWAVAAPLRVRPRSG